ncbi:hypothetical protein CFC21_066644 [Triticum aestivum]|uniref:Uncharacterized protein n=2 Tax=Triticum aestivum TaxID=4565 RepID=A0A3B6KL77_WHEAT|nr:hypothetical protein CFC21_066644 [Triticum aestivum]
MDTVHRRPPRSCCRDLPPLHRTGVPLPCFCVRACEDDDQRQVLLLPLTAVLGLAVPSPAGLPWPLHRPGLGLWCEIAESSDSRILPKQMQLPMIPVQLTQSSSSGSSMKILVIVMCLFRLISSGA